MGAKVIGCDINPVAHWAVRESLKPVDLSRLRVYFRQLENTAGKRIKALYRTRCVHCQQPADTLYAFWVRTIRCQNCQKGVLLHKHTLLNEGASRSRPLSVNNPARVFCPSSELGGSELAQCPHCSTRFDPYHGHYDEGFYRCPHCGKGNISLLDTIRESGKLQEVLVAIEYWCTRCGARLYKSPDEEDKRIIKHVTEDWSLNKIPPS